MSITVPLLGTAAVIIENPPGSPSPVPFKLRLAWVQFVLGSSLCPAVSPADFGGVEAAVPVPHHPRVTHVDMKPCHQPLTTGSSVPLQAALTLAAGSAPVFHFV